MAALYQKKKKSYNFSTMCGKNFKYPNTGKQIIINIHKGSKITVIITGE
jgi:hypothetical protein